MASSAEGFGKFDDIIFNVDSSGDKFCLFMQLKNKSKDKIRFENLLSEKHDFGLKNYYTSYMQIREKFEKQRNDIQFDVDFNNCVFVLYTNAQVEDSLKGGDLDDEQIPVPLQLANAGGNVMMLNKEKHKQVFDEMEQLHDFQNFINQFYIMYNQPNEDKFDLLIMSDIRDHLDISVSYEETIVDKYYKEITRWWNKQKRSFYLTDEWKEGNPLFVTSNHIKHLKITLLSDQRNIEIDNSELKFCDDALEEIKDKVSEENRVIIFSDFVKISICKLIQIFQNEIKYLIFKIKDLEEHTSEIQSAFGNGNFDVLILYNIISSNKLESFCQEISTICQNQRVIIVVDVENIKEMKTIKKSVGKGLVLHYDDVDFLHFDLNTQNKLKNILITFQGSELPLLEFGENLEHYLDGEFLSFILEDKRIVGTPLTQPVEWYISRTLQSYRVLDCNILRERGVIFCLCSELESWFTTLVTQEICTFQDRAQNRFLWVDDEQEFETVCREQSDVLWLQISDNKLILKRSYGAVQIVDRYLNSNDPVTWQPETLLDGHEKIVVVTAEPGMGKSTLLTHLSKQTKQQHPHLWIVRININDFTDMLSNFKQVSIQENNVIELLERAAKVENVLEKHLFTYCCEEGNMIVLVDGVDEISPDYSEVVYQILNILFNRNIKRVWITSRPFLKSKLGTISGVRSFEINPFNKSDQKEYISKLWKSSEDISGDTDINACIDEILKLVDKFLNDNGKDFTGIPLQIFMLAEVFVDSKCESINPDKLIEVIPDLNILELYDKFFDVKWRIYNEEKKKNNLTNVHVIKDDLKLKKEYIENCMLVALLTLFSNEALNLLNHTEIKTKSLVYLNEINQFDDKVGLIIPVSGQKPQFLHRTVAEYFAAKWLFDHHKNIAEFLKECIFRPEYVFTRRMLDYQLSQGSRLHMSVLNSNLRNNCELLEVEGAVNKQDLGGRTALHLAVMYQLPEETSILLEHGADEQIKDKLLSLSSVDYASYMCSIDFKFRKFSQITRFKSSEIITEIMKTRPEIRNTLSQKFLQSSVNLVPGNENYKYLYRMLQYYIIKGGIINVHVMAYLTIITRCAFFGHSKQKTVFQISNFGIKISNTIMKSDICKSARFGIFENEQIMEEGMNINSENFPTFPLLFDFPVKNNMNLAKVLTRNGVIVNTVAFNNSKTLFNVVDYCNTELGKLSIYYLSLNSSIMLPINLKSALGVAVQIQNVKLVTLLLESGAPVIASTVDAPLCVAVKMGHVDLCELLLKYEELNDLLFPLTVAIQFGQLQIVKILLYKWKNENINSGVISVVEVKHQNEITKFLLENLVRLHYKEFSLCVAAECGFLEMVKLLVELGEDVNKLDEHYGTPLIAAAQGGQFEVVRFLLSKGARVNIKDNLGKTALHASACSFPTEECATSNRMCRYVKVCLLLIQKGADVNAINNISTKITSLSCAVHYNHIDVARCLVKAHAHFNTFCHPYSVVSPLRFAIRDRLFEITNLLLSEHGSVNCQINNQHVPLCEVFRAPDVNHRIIELLLEKGADVNLTCNMKCFPQLSATIRSDIRTVDIFLSKGADVNVTMDDVGWSPLHIAVCLASSCVAQLLLRNGASLNLKDRHGRIPLHFAVCNSNFTAIPLLIKNSKMSLMVADENGWTPVFFAAKFGFAHRLRGMECGLCEVDKEDRTALFLSALNGHVEDVKFLLDRRAGVNVVNKHGLSPLHVAACGGHPQVVELLLTAGAHVNARDKYGFMPVNYAEWNNHSVVLKILKDISEELTTGNNKLAVVIRELNEWNNRFECEMWNECMCTENDVLKDHFGNNLDRIMRLQKS